MSIARQGDRWLVIARVRVNGKIIQRRETIDGTRELAKRRFEQLKHSARESADRSLTPTDDVRTFSGLLDLYHGKRGPFCAGHECRIRTLRDALGDVALGSFAERFDRYTVLLRTGRSNRTGKPLSNVHVNRLTEIARAAFQVGVDAGIVETNPIRAGRFPRLREMPRNVSLSPEDELRFLNIVGEQAPHILPFVQFSLAIPSRKTELVTARRTQIDLVGGTLMIPAKIAKARRPILKPLPPAMLAYFRNIPAGCEWVFFRQEKDGTYSPLGDFKKCFKRCCELAGVPWMRVHDLRHFAAQRLAARGVPEVAINAVAGWSNNSGMLSRYFGETPARVLSMIFEENGAKCEAQCEAQQALAG